MMDELIKVLEDNDIEVTEDLKEQIEESLPEEPDTDDLFTQDEVNEIVQKRLAREQKMYDQEIQDLKNEMEDLVDPEKVKEYETKIEELEGKAEQREVELKREYELQLAAKDAGVTDEEYFEFLIEKNGYKDRLSTDDDGNVIALDDDGEPLKDNDGNVQGPGAIVSELKEQKPEVFTEESKKKKKSTGDTNPSGGPTLSEEEKKKRAKDLSAEMGYKSKDKE